MHFYLDASALGKRHAAEPGTPLLNHLFSRVPLRQFHLLNLGVAEVVSILVKRNAGRLSAQTFAQAMVDLGKEISASAVEKLIIDHALVNASVRFIELRSLNATDAVILRSALDLADGLRRAGDDLALIASDQRLIRAAQSEGLATFDPETQTQTDLDALIGP